jgi:hypothetical protein
MVAEVCDEGVCPVRVFRPLNVGGTFAFGRSISSVDVVLWFRMTLPCHDDGSQEEKVSHPKGRRLVLIKKKRETSCGRKLGLQVEAASCGKLKSTS